jgi:hypothetical protein
MMSSLPWSHAPSESELKRSVRRAAALLLQGVASRLAFAAQQLAAAERKEVAPSRVPVLEFYAEAGAAEGALYVDGRLVGHLTGVTRL